MLPAEIAVTVVTAALLIPVTGSVTLLLFGFSLYNLLDLFRSRLFGLVMKPGLFAPYAFVLLKAHGYDKVSLSFFKCEPSGSGSTYSFVVRSPVKTDQSVLNSSGGIEPSCRALV